MLVTTTNGAELSVAGAEDSTPWPDPGVVQVFPERSNAAGDASVGRRAWTLTRPLMVGRSPDCGIRLDDARVSREHLAIERESEGLRIQDLGSRHGSSLNGVRLGQEPTHAPPGSVVRCGDTLLLVCANAELHAQHPHRITRSFLGTRRDVLAGPTLYKVWRLTAQVAALRHAVLVLGESGVGKEAIARLVHANRSTRGPFVALNVAAIAPGLFESELFGHARGAFTDARGARAGAFQEANGGVLFLDEVAELRADLQVKLLRALEDGRVRPVGSDRDVLVDVKVVAATNRNLSQAVARGTFRSDLYHRLAGIVIEVPPLRTRREEILPLACAMLEDEGVGLSLGADAAERLLLRSWAGNIRELAHVVAQASARAVSAGSPSIRARHLPEESAAGAPHGALTLDSVRRAMAKAKGKAGVAADLLGISRGTLYNYCTRQRVTLAELREGVAQPIGMGAAED